jgi:chromosome segregation ATPase
MATVTSKREEFHKEITALKAAVGELERQLGDATLSGDTRASEGLQKQISASRSRLEALGKGLEAAGREAAAEAEIERQRGNDRRRLALYQHYSAMLPIRARMLRAARELQAVQRELQALNQAAHPERHQVALNRAQQPFEHPGGIMGDGGPDPDVCDQEAAHFRALADGLRARLGGE